MGKDGKDWKTLKETMRKLQKTEQVGGSWHCENIRRRERERERDREKTPRHKTHKAGRDG